MVVIFVDAASLLDIETRSGSSVIMWDEPIQLTKFTEYIHEIEQMGLTHSLFSSAHSYW